MLEIIQGIIPQMMLQKFEIGTRLTFGALQAQYHTNGKKSVKCDALYSPQSVIKVAPVVASVT